MKRHRIDKDLVITRRRQRAEAELQNDPDDVNAYDSPLIAGKGYI